MINTNQFSQFLSKLADSGKVGWVQHTYSDNYEIQLGKMLFRQDGLDKDLTQAFFLKLADTLVPEGENPEVEKTKMWRRIYLNDRKVKKVNQKYSEDHRKQQLTIAGTTLVHLPKTHRLAVKHAIIDLFDQPDLDKAVDGCIKELSRFL